MTKATVLLPNYNNGQYLEECLVSIQNQSFQNFEVLIVDDGSTDNSLEIIKGFDDHRIKIIEKESNSGIIDSLNIGLNTIDSEYIIRMDGDDKMHPDRIKRLVEFMDTHKKYGVCGSGIQHFGMSDDKVIYEKNPLINKANLLFKHSIGHASVIFRNSVIKEHQIKYSNGYQFIEDYKIFYDLGKVTLMTSIQDLLYFYRREDYNLFRNREIKKNGYIKIYEEVLQDLGFAEVQKAANIHFELWNHSFLSFTKKTFDNHIKTLVSKNSELKIYPEKELRKVLNITYDRLFYRLAEQSKLSFFEGIPIFLKSRRKFYYYIKSKFK